MNEETPMSDGSGGFEVETGGIGEGPVGVHRQPLAKRDKKAERSANLKNTFGQGPGRIALIAIAVILLIFLTIGIRSCTHTRAPAKNDASVDVPGAPADRVSLKPVAPAEAKRHAEQSAKEAAAAQAAGKDYQTSFDPVIAKNTPIAPGTHAPSATFDVDTATTPAKHQATPGGQGSAPSQVGGLIPIGGAPANTSGDAAANGISGYAGDGATSAASAGLTPEQIKAQQDAEKAHMDAYKKAVAARDAWVTSNRDRVIKEAEDILGDGKDGNAIKYANYRAFSYPRQSNRIAEGAVAANGSISGGTTKAADSKARTAAEEKGPLLIKTGNSLYVTTNSLVNTDHGGQLFATVRGGTWDGSQVICAIERAPDNIRAHCTTMAPQDSRPTMKIDAVLLRESDMAQGIAEHINHHVIARYSALAVASLLQGYGQAYNYQQGTAVVTANGTVLQTSGAPSNRQVIGRALGEVGTNAGSEIMRGFDRPTTYSTPANQGMVLYFLSDVYAPSTSTP